MEIIIHVETDCAEQKIGPLKIGPWFSMECQNIQRLQFTQFVLTNSIAGVLIQQLDKDPVQSTENS